MNNKLIGKILVKQDYCQIHIYHTCRCDAPDVDGFIEDIESDTLEARQQFDAVYEYFSHKQVNWFDEVGKRIGNYIEWYIDSFGLPINRKEWLDCIKWCLNQLEK